MEVFTSAFILVSTFVLFAIALFVFLRDPKSMIHGSFFLYFFSLTTWSFGVFGLVSGIEGVSEFWLAMLSGGMVFLPSGFLLFLYNFLSTRHRPGRVLVFNSFLISIVFFILTFTPYLYKEIGPDSFGSSGIVQNLWYTFLFFFTFVLFYGEYLIYRDLVESEGRRFRQLMYLFLGHFQFLLGIYLSIPTMLGEAVFGGFPFWSLSSIAYEIFITFVLLKRNLPDLRFGIRFIVTRMLVTSLFASFFLAAVWVMDSEKKEWNIWVFALLGIFFLHVTGELYHLFKDRADRFFSAYLGIEKTRRSPAAAQKTALEIPPDIQAQQITNIVPVQKELAASLTRLGIVFEPEMGLPEILKGSDFGPPIKRSVEKLHEVFGSDFIGLSDEMYHVLQNVIDYSRMDRAVVFEGDSGTGKRAFARAMHNLRSGMEMKVISCREEKLPSIRGVVKRFMESHGDVQNPQGLLVCDVEYVKPELARILAPLFESFGGKKYVYFTTLNSDFARLDSHTRFFSGLNEIVIRIPSIQSRPEDTLILTLWQLLKHSLDENIPSLQVSSQFLQSAIDYPWPGNILELEKVLQDVALGSPEGVFSSLQLEGNEEVRSTDRLSPLEESEKKVILECLIKNRFNKNRTRLDLNITINTLNSKIQKYGIFVEE